MYIYIYACVNKCVNESDTQMCMCVCQTRGGSKRVCGDVKFTTEFLYPPHVQIATNRRDTPVPVTADAMQGEDVDGDADTVWVEVCV